MGDRDGALALAVLENGLSGHDAFAADTHSCLNREVAWIAELLIQGIWEGIVAVVFRKWGLVPGILALLSPFVIFGLVIWYLVS